MIFVWSGPGKVSRTGGNYASKRWGSIRRRKDRDCATLPATLPTTQPETLPSHLERGKNLSKRFRKSCRNWAASKGLIAQKTSKDAESKQETKSTSEDIVVIDLDEDPDIQCPRAPPEDPDIGRLVADLVLDAKRRNTLPRSGSKLSVGRESLEVIAPLAALEKSTAVNEEVEDSEKAELTSPSDLLDKSRDDSEAENVKLNGVKKVIDQILETSFDENDPKDVQAEIVSDEENKLETEAEVNANGNEDADDNITEVFESIGSTSFYNGISLNNEFAVRVGYSGELFKEETATSSGTSQLDQDGFTELSTFNISTDELLDEDINEKEVDDGNSDVNEDSFLTGEETPDESLGVIISEDDEERGVSKVSSEVTDDNLSDESEEEPGETCGENSRDQHSSQCLSVETYEHDFDSIAKISALDFLNDEESDEGEEEEDDMEETDLYQSYFSSSYLLSQRLFPKEHSFPSLTVSTEDEERHAKSGSYLEAINLELDQGENAWQNTGFRISSAEFRINPFYKEEDSLTNSLVLSSDNQTPTFNYNFQEFFDLWEMFSQECKDDKQAVAVHENSVGLCNLEAIQEEDETDEDSERDENNNYDFDDDDDTEYESEEDDGSKPDDDNIETQVQLRTRLYFDGEKAELIELEGEKNVTVDNAEKSGTVAVMAEDNAEKCRDTPDTEDYKLYEGLSCLFETQDAPDLPLGENLIGFGSDEMVEDYIESFLNSLILNIVSLEDMKDGDYSDDMDDEFYSCDSPIEDETELKDNYLHREFGSDKGLSTDEGIEATTDEDEDEESRMNNMKSKMDLEGPRSRSLVSTKF